jgi:hypothetical protein
MSERFSSTSSVELGDVDDDVSLTEVFLTGFPWTMRPLDNMFRSSSVDEASKTDMHLAVLKLFSYKDYALQSEIWMFVGAVMLHCELAAGGYVGIELLSFTGTFVSNRAQICPVFL